MGNPLAGHVGNARRFYVQSLDQIQPTLIPGTEGVTTAFFSPDGEWLGFCTDEGRLKKVRIEGGSPLLLSDVPNVWGGDWGPETTYYLVLIPGCYGSPPLEGLHPL